MPMKDAMRSLAQHVWTILRRGGLALLLASLLVGVFRAPAGPGLSFSTARAPLPVPPASAPEEEEQRDTDEKDDRSVDGQHCSRSRKPCRHESAGITMPARCPTARTLR